MADFQEIYNLYFRGVYKYALSLSRDPVVAEESMQETFFKAMKSIGSFRGQCRLYVSGSSHLRMQCWGIRTSTPIRNSLRTSGRENAFPACCVVGREFPQGKKSRCKEWEDLEVSTQVVQASEYG